MLDEVKPAWSRELCNKLCKIVVMWRKNAVSFGTLKLNGSACNAVRYLSPMRNQS